MSYHSRHTRLKWKGASGSLAAQNEKIWRSSSTGRSVSGEEGIGGVVVVRVEMQRQRREQRRLGLGDRAPPMVPEDAADLEIFVTVALRYQPGPCPEILCHSLSCELLPSAAR